MNKVLNWVFGSFFRTLGRVLVYIILGFLLVYCLKDFKLPKFNLSDLLFINVSAEVINIKDIADGYALINSDPLDFQTHIIDRNNNITDRIVIGTALSQSDIYSYIYIDICSSYDIEVRRTNGYGSACSNSCYSNSVYTEKTKYVCQTHTNSGYIYRVTTPIQKWEKDLNDEMAIVNDQLTIYNKTGEIISTTYYGIYLSNELNNGTFEVDYSDAINSITNQSITNSNSIINNQNQNKTDIINNQNANTDREIESQKVCKQLDKNVLELDNKALNYVTGSVFDINGYGISRYININQSTKITVLQRLAVDAGICFYNINKEKLSCIRNDSLNVNDIITIPDNSFYFRFTLNKNQNKPQFSLCENGNQATNDTLNDMNSSINNSDSSGASSDASSFFSNFTTDTHGLTGIITAPLNAINSLTSSSCSPLVLPLPFVNSNLTLPCMRTIYDEYFGSFMTIYDVITLGIVSYWVMVRIFGLVKDFKNPEHDEIEVLDL